MRTLGVLLTASALLAGLLASPAQAAVADALPITSGTYEGWSACDPGSCSGDLELQGRFALDSRRSLVTTATLWWASDDEARFWTGTIVGPRMQGTCEMSRESVGVSPVINVVQYIGVVCSVLLDGGPDGAVTWFSLVTDPVDLEGSLHTTGRILPSTSLAGLYPL